MDSRATDDADDRYSAHLIFGASSSAGTEEAEGISGFFGDSFGGDFTATGTGHTTADGFEIAYAYPPDSFVNHWSLAADDLR